MSEPYFRAIARGYRRDLPEAPNTISFRAFGSLWRRRRAARWVCTLALAFAFNPAVAISQATFAVIDVPGASYTTINGINNSGAIVGTYGDSAKTNHGFMRSGGTYLTLDVPGFIGLLPCFTGNSGFAETATGINDGGQIVGLYDRLDPTIPTPCLGASFKVVGFLFMNGSFQDIDSSNYFSLVPSSINDSGTIVGYYQTSVGRILVTHAFLFDHGVYTNIDVPGGSETRATGINNAGQIVGSYTDNTTFKSHGFLLSGGVYVTIDAPGAMNTLAAGINNLGEIAGNYSVQGSPDHIFVLSKNSQGQDVFRNYSQPGENPFASAINDSGQIVGGDCNQSGCHGFIATIAKDCSSVAQSCIAAPTNLHAKQVFGPDPFDSIDHGIQLTWNYSSDPIDGFIVENHQPSQSRWLPSQIVLSSNACNPPAAPGLPEVCAFTDTSVQDFSTMSYRMRAYKGADPPSDPSNEVTAFQLKMENPNGTAIEAKFSPDPTLTVLNAAQQLGYDHFNWVQIVDVDPQCYISSLDAEKLHDYQVASGIPVIGTAQLAPHLDPPPGGYFEYHKYEDRCDAQFNLDPNGSQPCQGPSDELPFLYNEGQQCGPQGNECPWYLFSSDKLNPEFDIASPTAGGSQSIVQTVNFYDQPDMPCLALPVTGTNYSSYFTSLVGVNTGIGFQPPNYTVLTSLGWSSNYHSGVFGIPAGGGIITLSSVPPRAGGTGGVFGLASVDIADLPLDARQIMIVAGAKGVPTSPKIDKDAPMTAAFLSGPQGAGGWYTGQAIDTLIATDIDGPSDVFETSYTLDAGSLTAYTGPFAVFGDGIHTVEFGSVDRAGNIETPRRNQQVRIDSTAPSIKVTAIASRPRQEDDKIVRIVISGSITDLTSGVNPTSAMFALKNEDGIRQAGGPVTLGADGKYSFTSSSFDPTRRREDKEERERERYEVTVSAQDIAGNQGSSSAFVVNHRERGDHDDEGHPNNLKDDKAGREDR